MFETRLVGWKRNFLSKSGRYTLIKNTFANLPVYYLTTLTILASIAKRLETIQCQFLWGDGEDCKKFHLIKWDEVKKPLYLKKIEVKKPLHGGSLGIRLVMEFNKALQGKWLWRFLKKDGRMWRRVIAARWQNCALSGTGSLNRRGHGLGLWKKIKMGWPGFKESLTWKVGRGTVTRFWHDQ